MDTNNKPKPNTTTPRPRTDSRFPSAGGASKGSYGGERKPRAFFEKPKPEVAPSTLAVVGRYVLPAETFAALREVKAGAGGEIQLTDGIACLLASHVFLPHRFNGVRFDCGSKLGYLQANVALGLRDGEIGQSFQAWLKTL